MQELLNTIRKCTVCTPHLPLGANPIIAASATCKLVIIGQAPSKTVHETSKPWNDKSGDNLRSWLGIDKTTFYDSTKIALLPMGFCYPGKSKTGDLPPRSECAPLWHSSVLAKMTNVKMILLVGQYSQNYYLDENKNNNLTDRVHHFRDYLPRYLPLPHPSPRNINWHKDVWFQNELLPYLKNLVLTILQ